MLVRLRPDTSLCSLKSRLNEVRAPLAVRDFDLTNCIRLSSFHVIRNIYEFRRLRCLRCVAFHFKTRDLCKLIENPLPHLVEIELSLVSETRTITDELRMMKMAGKRVGAHTVPQLRRVYVEVSYKHNFEFLSVILSLCHYVEHLHVHFVRGCFSEALLYCRNIIEKLQSLETFTFTSERPSYILNPTAPLNFMSCAAICGNVSYRKSTDSWSCVRLRDLAHTSEPRVLPFQLVVAAGYTADGLMAECIRVASEGHIWTKVRLLCLLLFPEEPSGFLYPAIGDGYRNNLRQFFGTALRYIVELNITMFHFAPDLDITDLLQDGSLEHLHALSASPCGLRRPSALRRLAQNCLDFCDLDVRFEAKYRFERCAGCEGEFLLDTKDAIEMRTGVRALFRNGLARLTLSGVHDSECLWFIESCSPTPTVRLIDCPSYSSPEFARLGAVLKKRSSPSCLVLRIQHLEDNLLSATISHVNSLQYLYVLSAASLSDDVAEACLRLLGIKQPRLKYLHVHYKGDRNHDFDQRLTLIRTPCPKEEIRDVLVRNGPCIQSCSTATFIGLAKPLNRNVQPML
ncbi:hypothetical protein HPB50_000455 [Hyalomma asiaticum]|uniref:Uncharacterized protein n=1 Tax=Hyalomma asiaticum TaxID=266040 RepID=A0ACB7TCD2_HYAAI|nr:hypothetical protein HPB50_000455 [Hyalomma asiaticum]